MKLMTNSVDLGYQATFTFLAGAVVLLCTDSIVFLIVVSRVSMLDKDISGYGTAISPPISGETATSCRYNKLGDEVDRLWRANLD